MEKAKTDLKLCGFFFIFIAILDIINISVTYFSGDFNEAYANIDPSAPQFLVTAITVILLAIYAIDVLVSLYLGVKGVKQANGNGKGKGHIIIARILLVLLIISTALSVFTLSLELASILRFISDIATISIIFSYIKCAKTLLNE